MAREVFRLDERGTGHTRSVDSREAQPTSRLKLPDRLSGRDALDGFSILTVYSLFL